MKEGFKYYLDNKRLKDYDVWEKAIKNINVETNVIGLELHAKTIKTAEKDENNRKSIQVFYR